MARFPSTLRHLLSYPSQGIELLRSMSSEAPNSIQHTAEAEWECAPDQNRFRSNSRSSENDRDILRLATSAVMHGLHRDSSIVVEARHICKFGLRHSAIAPKLATFEGVASTVAFSQVHKLLLGTVFDYLAVALILANVLFTFFNINAQIRFKRGEVDSIFAYRVVETGFLGLFLLELAARFIANTFRTQLDKMIFFELLVVLIPLINIWLDQNEPVVVSVISCFRVVRLAHTDVILGFSGIFKIVRALGLALQGLRLAFPKAIMMLFFLFIYVYSLTPTVTFLLGPSSSRYQFLEPNLLSRFNSIAASFVTVWEVLCHGFEFGPQLISPLIGNPRLVAIGIAVLIMSYVSQTVLVNLLAGHLIEGAMKFQGLVKQSLHIEEKKSKWRKIERLKNTFDQLDEDKTGSLSWLELSKGLHQHKDLFEEIHVPLSQAKGLFDLIDMDKSGSVSTQEFLLGLIDLMVPKSFENLILQYEQQASVRRLLTHSTERRFQLDALNNKLQEADAKVNESLNEFCKVSRINCIEQADMIIDRPLNSPRRATDGEENPHQKSDVREHQSSFSKQGSDVRLAFTNVCSQFFDSKGRRQISMELSKFFPEQPRQHEIVDTQLFEESLTVYC